MGTWDSPRNISESGTWLLKNFFNPEFNAVRRNVYSVESSNARICRSDSMISDHVSS